MATFSDRIVGAMRLDVHTYEEVERDTGATGQAMGVVVLSSVAAGIGNVAWGGLSGLVAGLVGAIVGWVAWAAIIYLVGARLMPESQTHADVAQLLRALGFAQAPGLLRVLGIIPFLGRLIMLVVAVWMIIATVIAVRQALDYTSTARAVVVCLIGFVGYVVISMIIMAPFALMR